MWSFCTRPDFIPRPKAATLPARIHLFFLPLPPYSPELNPVEGLWDQVQDCTGNRRHARTWTNWKPH